MGMSGGSGPPIWITRNSSRNSTNALHWVYVSVGVWAYVSMCVSG